MKEFAKNLKRLFKLEWLVHILHPTGQYDITEFQDFAEFTTSQFSLSSNRQKHSKRFLNKQRLAQI